MGRLLREGGGPSGGRDTGLPDGKEDEGLFYAHLDLDFPPTLCRGLHPAPPRRQRWDRGAELLASQVRALDGSIAFTELGVFFGVDQ